MRSDQYRDFYNSDRSLLNRNLKSTNHCTAKTLHAEFREEFEEWGWRWLLYRLIIRSLCRLTTELDVVLNSSSFTAAAGSGALCSVSAMRISSKSWSSWSSTVRSRGSAVIDLRFVDNLESIIVRLATSVGMTDAETLWIKTHSDDQSAASWSVWTEEGCWMMLAMNWWWHCVGVRK